MLSFTTAQHVGRRPYEKRCIYRAYAAADMRVLPNNMFEVDVHFVVGKRDAR